MDGDEDALQGEFPSDFQFTHAEDGTGNPIKKRETLARDDPNLMDWVFEHEESHHLVYCRKGREDKCQRVFQGGAYDTIIGLPAHSVYFEKLFRQWPRRDVSTYSPRRST